MQISETKTEGLEREYKVVIPAKEINDKVMERLTQIAQSANLPGFRPGKAPVSLLKKKYGPAVMGEVLQEALNDSTVKVVSDNKLRPVGQPDIQISKFDDGHDLEFTMSLEIAPEFEPVDLKTIELERLVAEPKEEEVEASLKRVAEANRTIEKVEESRAAVKGDHLQIDFVGSIDGVEFPGGKAEDYVLELGSGSFIPGFEDQLVGAKAGEDRKVNVDFPADYGAADLAGKKAVFDVKVKELRQAKTAEISDELAKKLGLENVDALKKAVRESYEGNFKQLSKARLKRALLDALNDAHDFQVPKKVVEQEAKAIWEQFEKHRSSGQGAEDEDVKGKSDDELKAEFQEIAERRVRLGLVLGEIGRRNNIEVTQDDLNKAIAQQARNFPGNEKAVMEFYRKQPEQREALRAPIFEDKIVDFILEMSKITDRKVTPEELQKEPEEPKAKEKKAKKKK
jgi:trigger factor